MLSLAVAALLEMGASAPERHIFLAATGKIATIIVALEPFSPEDLDALHEQRLLSIGNWPSFRTTGIRNPARDC